MTTTDALGATTRWKPDGEPLLRRIERRTLIPLMLLGPALAVATVTLIGRGGAYDTALRAVLLADIAYLALFGALVASRVWSLFAARRAGRIGSKLHLRLAGTFAAVALVPAVAVAAFATVSVNLGIEAWFSERVGSVVTNALDVARAYEREHRENIRGDVLAMANDLNRAAGIGGLDQARLSEIVRSQALLRELPEAFVFTAEREIVARGEFSYLFSFEPPTDAELARARAGEVVITGDEANDEIRALVYLTNFFDVFLYVSREVDGEVLRLLDDTEDTVRLYEQLEAERGTLLRDFALFYVGFALLIIAASTLAGFWFAERLARPVGRLASAAERIGEGDLGVRVKEERGRDEIAILSRSFNRMAGQLARQREALIAAHRDTERRRMLTEAVLAGVTAGVFGLDGAARIDTVNEAAAQLFDIDARDARGRSLDKVAPAFAGLLDAARDAPSGVAQGAARIRVGGQSREFLARVALKARGRPEEGFVVTFDDVTALASAQRAAAWGDVARRIAHEIKNPLTPIQLSADRLRRRFANRLGEDAEKVERMLDVITRQAGQIRRMVDAFSRFARLPDPVLAPEDLGELVRETILLHESGQAGETGADGFFAETQEGARPPVRFLADLPDGPLPVLADRGLLGQALTNLLQNAADAIAGRHDGQADAPAGIIHVSIREKGQDWRVEIADNGVGLPAEGRERLADPYVTTRARGTGLGLAIVRKIVEQHDGTLSLCDADGRAGCDGALSVLRLPCAAARPAARTAPGTATPGRAGAEKNDTRPRGVGDHRGHDTAG